LLSITFAKNKAMEFLKGKMLYSILKFKCPRCQSSDLFTHKNPYRTTGFFDMPKHCDSCGQKFELEVGFYYGSMYVSYALSIALGVSIFVAMAVLYPDFKMHEFLILLVTLLIIATPFLFRLSRVIWINLFVKYDAKAIEKHVHATSNETKNTDLNIK
jgi:uncharacterized protein (DUF983 family)